MNEDGVTETERWVVVWFHPNGDREKAFKRESAARKFARQPDVDEWNPLLLHRITTVVLTEEILPL